MGEADGQEDGEDRFLDDGFGFGVGGGGSQCGGHNEKYLGRDRSWRGAVNYFGLAIFSAYCQAFFGSRSMMLCRSCSCKCCVARKSSVVKWVCLKCLLI